MSMPKKYLYFVVSLLILLSLNSVAAEPKTQSAAQYGKKMSSPDREARLIWHRFSPGKAAVDWDGLCKQLSDAGINVILPLMGNSGHASYASDAIPRDKQYEKFGDQVEQALAAGKKYGVSVHVWKVAFKCDGSSREYIQKMRKEGRLQKSFQGEESAWLCPSDERNQNLEVRLAVELAQKYKIDGIQLDYARYDNDNFCFCGGCKKRFEKFCIQKTGKKLQNWPQCVRKDKTIKELWLSWRQDQVTNVVVKVRKALKALRPELQLSAAVFACDATSYKTVLARRGQNWVQWAQKKYVDFVCPMDYFNQTADFRKTVEYQKKLVKGSCPIYPGIGLYSSRSELGPLQTLEQIQVTRDLKLGGVAFYQYTEKVSQTLFEYFKSGPFRNKAGFVPQ